MDEVDRAAALSEAHLERALASRRFERPVTAGIHCLLCGEEIPQQRRAALPGTAWCVECAAEFEASRGFGGRR